MMAASRAIVAALRSLPDPMEKLVVLGLVVQTIEQDVGGTFEGVVCVRDKVGEA